jgi:hypothetical protein
MTALVGLENLSQCAEGLDFLQRQELVIWPALKTIIEAMEADSPDLEKRLDWFAKYLHKPSAYSDHIPLITTCTIQPNTAFTFPFDLGRTRQEEDIGMLAEAGESQPQIAQILLYCLGRSPKLRRKFVHEAESVGEETLAVIKRYSDSRDACLRVCARALLLQLNGTKSKSASVAFLNADDVRPELQNVKDSLTRRRIVALAHPAFEELPDIVTLSDPDAYIIHRAVQRLLAAGTQGDALLMSALRGDDPYAIAGIYMSFGTDEAAAANFLERNPNFSKCICKHLESGLLAVRMAVTNCLAEFPEGALSPHPDLKEALIRQALDKADPGRIHARRLLENHWGIKKSSH